MFRSAALVLTVLGASLSVLVGPVLGAETFTVRESGLAINVGYSNVSEDAETLPPGAYYVTWVMASSHLETKTLNGGGGEGVCVLHQSVTIEEDGSYSNEFFFFACGDAQTLTIDRRMGTGRVVATIQVTECVAWDEETHGCSEFVDLGELAVDLTVAGEGPISRYRSAGSGGVAGVYTSTYHGTGSSRMGTPSGTVTLDGASLIDDPVQVAADLLVTKTGWVEVQIEQ